MELSAPLMQLLSTLGLPVWLLIPVTAVLTLLLKDKLKNIPLPKLPSNPEPVPPEPTPVNPVPDSPILPNNPILDALLRLLLNLRAKGAVNEEKMVSALIEQELSRKS